MKDISHFHNEILHCNKTFLLQTTLLISRNFVHIQHLSILTVIYSNASYFVGFRARSSGLIYFSNHLWNTSTRSSQPCVSTFNIHQPILCTSTLVFLSCSLHTSVKISPINVNLNACAYCEPTGTSISQHLIIPSSNISINRVQTVDLSDWKVEME